MSVSSCKRCRVKKANRPGTLCHVCFRAAGGKVEKKVGVSRQLDAIRKAMRWDREALPKHPSVRFYVELRSKNPREVTLQWERLEREHRLSRPVPPPPVEPVQTTVPGVEADSDWVEPDPVGEKLEAMIEAWLAETRARVDSICPKCGQRVEGKS
jgi:hypothetical protein